MFKKFAFYNLKNSNCLIIPGVGSYDKASEYLHTNDLVEPIKEFASSGHMIIGICLGSKYYLKRVQKWDFERISFINGKVDDSSIIFGKIHFMDGH